MAKIHEKNLRYSLLKIYSDFLMGRSYRRSSIIGTENIPTDGAVIIAPNHTNALMDALNILRSRKEMTVFGARADLFKIKLVGAFMRFLRIVPLVRERDGIRNVLENLDTMDTISEVLLDGVPFCLFCEGTHSTKHSLLPIKKGIFRTAWNVLDKKPDSKVYIVPTGLEYGDYLRFRSTCLIEFGEPLDLGAFINDHNDMPQGDIYKELRVELAKRISKLISYIPDDSDYEAKWALTKLVCSGEKGSLESRRDEKRRIAETIEDNLADPERESAMRELLADVLSYDKKRKNRRISSHSFSGCRAKGLLKLIAVIGLLPLFVASAVLTLPVWLTAWAVCRKTKDLAFHNSLRLGLSLVTIPVSALIWMIVGLFALPLSGWQLAAAIIGLMIVFVPLVGFFYDYKEMTRRTISDLRLLLFGSKLKKEQLALKNRFFMV